MMIRIVSEQTTIQMDNVLYFVRRHAYDNTKEHFSTLNHLRFKADSEYCFSDTWLTKQYRIISDFMYNDKYSDLYFE